MTPNLLFERLRLESQIDRLLRQLGPEVTWTLVESAVQAAQTRYATTQEESAE